MLNTRSILDSTLNRRKLGAVVHAQVIELTEVTLLTTTPIVVNFARRSTGRKSHAQLRPDVVRLAKRLHQASRTGDRRSLREISIALAKAGYVNFNGQPFNQPASRQ